ncbi:uncharacterized protein [Maniola hyperantus]|uniref:uncharacterized protein n=1 Tax=Aphantopus hyperantus TaxID=2795564 RepID=UPI0037481D88
MPASSINLYMQDAKIKFEAMRPVPVCTDTSMLIGHCQKIHISTNCYYGYHDTKSLKNVHEDADCEMVDLSREGREADTKAISLPLSNTRKRSANHDTYYSQTKRIREEVQIKKRLEPETIEKKKLDTSSEDLLEALYWNLHGGSYFHLCQCL